MIHVARRIYRVCHGTMRGIATVVRGVDLMGWRGFEECCVGLIGRVE